MTASSERPLITFALISYREENYIQEAIAAAFAQTYSPLEIVLSNDCSSDRTFEIMQEMAARYRGPHTIVLNRNERNLGTGGHINRVMKLSRGEIVVIAAGDDVSVPERTEKTYEAFRNGGGSVKSFFSNAVLIDESGSGDQLEFDELPGKEQFLLRNIVRSGPFGIVAGSSHAWTRDVFTAFGPLRTPLSVEDSAIAFRSALLGRIVYSPDALVKHRRHGKNTWQYTLRDPLRDIRYQTFEGEAVLQNWAQDVHSWREMMPEKENELAGYEELLRRRIAESGKTSVSMKAPGQRERR